MSLTKNQKNQRTSRAWLFNKTRDSTSRTKKVAKTKKELSEQINKDVMAYINAGGQIQKCPSCAYSPSEIEKLGDMHKRSIEGAI